MLLWINAVSAYCRDTYNFVTFEILCDLNLCLQEAMGPKRASRPAPYNPDLPVNWTAARLKEALDSRGIAYSSNARRSALVRLYTESEFPGSINRTVNDSARSHDPPHINGDSSVRRSRDAPQQNNNGDHGVLIDLVSKLSSTVQSLQQNVVHLTSRVNSLQATAINPSSTARNNDEPGSETPANSTTTGRNPESSFTLDTAFARISAAAAGSPTQSLELKRTRFGFAAESLPLVETISPQLRHQITSGKDVNLASLLIPYFSPHDENDDTKKPDKRLQKSLNIGEFIQAFGIYKNIMCQAYPQRRQELDLYERDIIDMATRYPGNGFYEYHRQFSLMAASHLKYNNILIDWSVRNNTLFCNLFANARPQSCATCNSTLHSTGFCPVTDKVRDKRNGDMDFYGRRREFHEGREICNNFNGFRGCHIPRCKNAHICISCRGDHSKHNCSSKNSQQPHTNGAFKKM